MNNIRFDSQVCAYLPDWYKDVADYQQICSVETALMETAEALTKRVYGNFYFATMDANALSEWESILGIIASSTETLEFRRARVANRVSMKPPYTITFLKKKLDELLGAGQYEVYVDAANYTLIVESVATNQDRAAEVGYTISRLKPAHIVFINKPYLPYTVLVGETVSTSDLVYNYKLGSWGLGLLPFSTQTAEEVIKVATTPSITAEYLASIAESALSEVSSVLINGTLSVTDLTKTRDGNVLNVEFTLTSSDVQTVTSIQLLDADENVLTDNTVYIPISQTTIIDHRITVKEG